MRGCGEMEDCCDEVGTCVVLAAFEQHREKREVKI